MKVGDLNAALTNLGKRNKSHKVSGTFGSKVFINTDSQNKITESEGTIWLMNIIPFSVQKTKFMIYFRIFRDIKHQTIYILLKLLSL